MSSIIDILTIVILMTLNIIEVCEAGPSKSFGKRISKLEDTIANMEAYDRKFSDLQKEVVGLKKELADKITGHEKEIAPLKNSISSAVTTDTSGKIPLSALPMPYNIGVNTVDASRIKQSILPGYYARFTVEDLTWKSQHQAVTVACSRFGSTNHGVALPTMPGSTCNETCKSYHSSYSCIGVIDLRTTMERVASKWGYVGVWRTLYCGSSPTDHHSSETTTSDDLIIGENGSTYCCCAE